MKKLLIYCLLIIFTLGFNSCGKDSSSSTTVTVYVLPVDIAARYIAMAFCNASEGINLHIEKFGSFSASGRSSFDSSFLAKKMDSSAIVKYQYQVVYSFNRLTTTPPQTTFDYTAGGGFSSDAIVSSDEQTSSNWTISTLDQGQLTLNGSGTDGGQQYASLEKVYFSSDFHYTFQNLKINKLSGLVVSGTATITDSGSGPGGVGYNYSGTITFTGDRKAELVLGGSTFYFSLSSGSVTK